MICDYIPSVLNYNIFSCLKLNAVHPQAPVAPKYSEFFEINNHRKIRIIHITPKNEYVPNISHKSVDSDDYWFTSWNKPIRNDACNCSFRRSHRGYNVKFKLNSLGEKVSASLETFVERIITNALLIAYQEYLKNNSVIPEIRNKNKKYYENTTVTKKKTNQKPAVLLLHGIGSSAEVWWNVLNCLVNAGYEVLAPDMLGHGYSSVPGYSSAYTFKNLLQDIILIFDKYIGNNGVKQCIVIGHSFGCSLAGALARYRAQQIVQLVLISGGGPTPLAPLVPNSEMILFNCLQVLIKPLLFCGIKRTMFFSSRGKHFEVCDVDSTVPSHVLKYISEGQYWPEGDATFHRRILIPTLLVHGLQDNQITLVQECEMERTIPRSFLEIIPTAGHMAMTETPNQLCHMLLCFINWWNK